MVKIFIDLEMIPIPKGLQENSDICRNEIIQMGAVALDYQDSFIGEFDQLVKPQYSDVITPDIYRLTGITTEMLNQGISFQEVMVDFAAWCKKISDEDNYEIFAWSNNDLIQLQQELMLKDRTDFFDLEFMNVWKDYQFVFKELLGINSLMSLDKAIKALDIDFVGNQHNALNDARNTAKLYQMVQNKELFEKAMKPIKDMMKPIEQLSTPMGSVFNLAMFDFGDK
jgi:3'-5' exoribonuclease 1